MQSAIDQVGAIEMDPSSNDIISSESQPDQPAKNITFMDVALYEAAAAGNIEEFNNYQGFELESLKTPNHNTVLHVYLEAKDPSDVLDLDNKSGSSFILSESRSICSENWRSETSYIEQILNMCPSLLLQANAKGQTPLHVAARYGHSAIVKFLINHAKANYGDLENPGMDQLKVVREMLRKTDLESNTALHVAAQYGHLRVVKELLEFEDPDFPYSVNANQETPVYIAARRGDGPLLTMIFDKLKSTVYGGPQGRTALHAAAMAGNAEAIGIILNNKRNLTQQTDENGQTPLHYAADLGHSSVVQELLKWDKLAAYIADKKSDMTPLLMAAKQGHEQTVREIISYCPDCCEMVDKTGSNLFHFLAVRQYSPLHFLEGYGEPKYRSIRKLIDEKDGCGITPQQVYDTSLSADSKRASFNNNQRTEEREHIVEILDEIVNEEVAESPRATIRTARYTSAESIEKAREAHLLLATLIATVTFAAAITVPGGYKTDKGSDQGTPFLIHDAAFITFVISDTLAFIFSIIAIALHFQMAFPFISNRFDDNKDLFDLAATYIIYALWAILIAFSTGTFAVLRPSPKLAIALLCLGLFFSSLLWLLMLPVLGKAVCRLLKRMIVRHKIRDI